MTGKTAAILWLTSSVVMTIGSLFVFSVGWDKLKDYLDSSQVEGRIQRPVLAGVLFEPSIVLVGISDSDNIQLRADTNGRFSAEEISPGRYQLQIFGKGIRKIQREVDIPKRKALDLGEFPLKIDTSALLLKEEHPSFRIATVGIGPRNTLWAVGFKENDYKVFVKSDNRWSETLIPQFRGAIQVVEAHLFNDGSFLLGSIGNGAVVSRDHAHSWESVKLPADVWGVSRALELPDKSWLLAALTGQRYVKSNGALLISKDKGKTWKMIFRSDDDIQCIKRLSSNRLVLGTSSLSQGATIHYSDDFGETWNASEIKAVDKPLRGITTILELNTGTLLAGTQDGRSWKGDLLRGGAILSSIDGGVTWKTLFHDQQWKDVGALNETADNKLLAWSGIDVMLSQDMGQSWSHAFQTGSGYRDTLVSVDQQQYVIGGDQLYKFASGLDEQSLSVWLHSN